MKVENEPVGVFIGMSQFRANMRPDQGARILKKFFLLFMPLALLVLPTMSFADLVWSGTGSYSMATDTSTGLTWLEGEWNTATTPALSQILADNPTFGIATQSEVSTLFSDEGTALQNSPDPSPEGQASSLAFGLASGLGYSQGLGTENEFVSLLTIDDASGMVISNVFNESFYAANGTPPQWWSTTEIDSPSGYPTQSAVGYALVSSAPPVVPLPATAPLLLLGMTVMIFGIRRRA